MTPKTAIRNNKGFTLLEVLVAVFVLSLVVLPLLNLFVFNTKVVRQTGEAQDVTYAAQSVMEDLQPLNYSNLYALSPSPGTKGSYQIKSVANSSTVLLTKTVSIDRIPYGAFNSLVSGTACYAHLIITGSNCTLTTPDGVMRSGLSSSSAITMTSTTITVGGTAYNLNKPSGANLILIINAGSSAISALNISLNSNATYVLYALATTDSVTQNITVTGGGSNSKEYRKFNSKSDSTADPPPSYMLVNAVCKVYAADNSTVTSIVQNTLKVSLS
jgi:prepilin-type N-terminal cleavage/methylation domain-containing protein